MDKEYVKVLLRMPKELKDKLSIRADKERRTLTNLIVVMLEDILNAEEQK